MTAWNSAKEDIRLLRKLVKVADEAEDEDAIPGFHGGAIRAFRDMLAHLEAGRQPELTAAQRKWAKNVAEKVLGEVHYENLISSGKAPRGREVPLPAVLQNLPKKPPPRKHDP
jgi:hypothetical protein